MNKKVFIVIDDNAENGINSFIFESKSDAIKKFNKLVESYKKSIGELGNGEINKYYAFMTDKFDYEIARVFWEEQIVQ